MKIIKSKLIVTLMLFSVCCLQACDDKPREQNHAAEAIIKRIYALIENTGLYQVVDFHDTIAVA